MKKRITIYIVVIVTLINLSFLGTIIYLKWVAKNDTPVSVLPENRFELIKKELKLTPVQVEQFKKIRTEFHTRLDTLDTEFDSLRKEMMKEIWQEKADSQRIENILGKFSKLQVETQRGIVQHFSKFKEVLTPEQSEKFYKIVSERFPDQEKNHYLRPMPNSKRDRE